MGPILLRTLKVLILEATGSPLRFLNEWFGEIKLSDGGNGLERGEAIAVVHIRGDQDLN